MQASELTLRKKQFIYHHRELRYPRWLPAPARFGSVQYRKWVVGFAFAGQYSLVG